MRTSEVGFDSAGEVTTTAWQYDGLSRLIEETLTSTNTLLTDYTATYAFGTVGNRKTMTKDAGSDGSDDETTVYSYDENDRLLTEIFDHASDDDKDRHTVYDYYYTEQRGKTVSRGTTPAVNPIETTTQEYNLQGRLEEVTIAKDDNEDGTADSSTTSNYVYNTNGIRVEQTVDSETTQYIVDENNHTGYAQVLEAYNTTTAKRTTYTIGLRVLAQHKDLVPLYLLTDAHGSTRLITNSALTALTLYFYDAYGNMLGNVDPATLGTNILYSGEQFDAATGNQYLRARYYNSAIGRFNRLDPYFGNLQNPQSFNKYTYAHGNPIMGYDPSGLFSINEINIGMFIQSSLISLNFASGIYNAKNTLQYTYKALDYFSRGDFENGLVATAGAIFYLGMTALSAIGVARGFFPPSGPPGLAQAVAIGGTGEQYVWYLISASPAYRKWLVERLGTAIISGIPMFFQHKADWQLRDSDGRIKTRGSEVSGSESSNPGRLNWQQQLFTHTERKILRGLMDKARPGDIISIQGSLNPCKPGCIPAMNNYAKEFGVKIIYRTKDQVWLFE